MGETSAGFTITEPHGIHDADGNIWNLIPVSGRGYVVDMNGSLDHRTHDVVQLLYYNHRVYQQNSDKDWWYYDISQSYPWVQAAGDPQQATA